MLYYVPTEVTSLSSDDHLLFNCGNNPSPYKLIKLWYQLIRSLLAQLCTCSMHTKLPIYSIYDYPHPPPPLQHTRTGTPITRIPIMAKQPLDLYKLFKLVVDRGGLVEVAESDYTVDKIP